MPKPLLKTVPAQESAGPRLSAARHDLAEALMDLRTAEKRHKAAHEPIARLDGEIAAADAARAHLAALDAAYADRMADWARTGEGPAPAPPVDERRAATDVLNAAAIKADAARGALTPVRGRIDEAAVAVARADARIRPAMAAALREDGAALTVEYWRLYSGLERVRRNLAALDQVLIADFPITHAATGRPIVDWVSPDKLSALQALHAIDAAYAGMAGIEDFAQEWRAKAGGLWRGDRHC